MRILLLLLLVIFEGAAVEFVIRDGLIDVSGALSGEYVGLFPPNITVNVGDTVRFVVEVGSEFHSFFFFEKKKNFFFLFKNTIGHALGFLAGRAFSNVSLVEPCPGAYGLEPYNFSAVTSPACFGPEGQFPINNCGVGVPFFACPAPTPYDGTYFRSSGQATTAALDYIVPFSTPGVFSYVDLLFAYEG
jgi:hypothetical protein